MEKLLLNTEIYFFTKVLSEFAFGRLTCQVLKKGIKVYKENQLFRPLLLLILRHNKLQTIGFCS